MSIRNLSHLMSLLALRGEIIFTLDQLTAHPATAAHVPTFEALRDEWGVVFGQELTLRDGLSATNARVLAADNTLNNLASHVSKALLIVTGDDRTHPLYVAFFKKKPLSEFRRPILGLQLEAMRGWIQPLKTSPVPSLAQLGIEVEAAVEAADQAVATRAALEAESAFFREAGNRKIFFDRVNAVRKQTHGELATMPHENMGLPASFAAQFFRHDSARNDGNEPTLESVDQELAALEAQMNEKREIRARLEAEAELAARDASEQAAKEAAIAELEKLAAEGEQKVAEARAKIAELSR